MDTQIKSNHSSFNFPKLIFICFLISIVIFIKYLSPDDSWFCKNGEWVRLSETLSSKPDTTCSGILEISPR